MKIKMILAGCIMAFTMFTGAVFADDQVDFNPATVEQFQVLKGIGGKTASAIVTYRQKHGGFQSVADLVHVKGIGEKKLAKIEGQLMVSKVKAKK